LASIYERRKKEKEENFIHDLEGYKNSTKKEPNSVPTIGKASPGR
jgi:hypothetical protein